MRVLQRSGSKAAPRHEGRWRIPTVGLVALMALGACGNGTEGDSSVAAIAAATTVSSTATQNPAASPGDIDQYAEEHYPDAYAGLIVDGSQIQVYRIATAAVMDEEIRNEFPGSELQFKDSPHSRKQLEAISSRVSSDKDYWYGRSVEISMISVPSDGTRVEIGVKNPDAAQAELYARYGKDLIKVIYSAGYVEPK